MPDQSPTLEIIAFPLGVYQTNCYVVNAGELGGFVVDCGFEPDRLIQLVQQQTRTPEAVVLTHAHLDHIGGLFAFRKHFPDVPIWIHEAEEQWLLDPERNLSALLDTPTTAPPADRLLREGDVLELAGQRWAVLHTPGHSPGSVTLYCEAAGLAFVGDTLFNGSVGRTDFPGCSMETLSESIRTKLYTLPDETDALPGHGPATTIGHEKATNPYVRP